MPKLIFIGEPFGGRVYELTLEKTAVGRGAQNTLAIHDPSVSLAHCEILVHGPEVIVRDLGSANGTFVNGARLNDQQAQLKSGQLVRFGSVEARLELDPGPQDDTATEQTTVQAMGRIMRDQRRERNNPAPPDPSMTLDDGSGAGRDEHTVILKKDQPPAKNAIRPAAEVSANPPERSSRKRMMLMLAALAVGAIVLLWLWWGKK